MSNYTDKKSITEEQKLAEKLQILANADQSKEDVFSIFNDGSIGVSKEFDSLTLDYSDTDNPEEKFELFYKGIQKLLRTHLPKGPEYKQARDYIYEEKKVYMTRGHRINEKGIRGHDSRMGYISDAKEILKMITDWVIKDGTMVELHNTIREENIKKGYGPRKVY